MKIIYSRKITVQIRPYEQVAVEAGFTVDEEDIDLSNPADPEAVRADLAKFARAATNKMLSVDIAELASMAEAPANVANDLLKRRQTANSVQRTARRKR